MSKSPNPTPPPSTLLRSRAEEQLRCEERDLASLSPEEAQAVLHELHVHQIELEMQNEQLRLTQAELEKSRERYVNLYDFAPVGYLTISEGGIVEAANLTSVEMLGVERSRLLAMPFSRFVLKDDQDCFYLCLRKAFNSDLSQTCELRLRPLAGAVIDARLEMLQASEEDRPVCHLTLSDITEHKRAEEALRENERRRLQYENEERLRLAFEAGDLGAWDQDFGTGQIVCSDRTRAMLGFAHEELVTWEAFLGLVHSEDCSEFLRALEESTKPKGPGRCDVVFRIVLPGGALRWLRFAARCFFEPNPAGKAVRRTGVLADITRQKETEELLASRARQLEVLVQERTAKLREAVGELEHFSYTLAHDLRAPLRAIRGFSDLLLAQATDLSPIHRRFLERSSGAVERMDQLVLDALNYNKIVRAEFMRIPVDCRALLEDLIESYPQFQEARAGISISGTIPPVLGNPALLTQCFSNLLNNALKFVAAGKVPRVRIFAQDLGPRVRIWVEDNGIGIPEDCHQKVFEMFQRLSLDYEGTGIGLALVKKAAERMQGVVGVDSEPGKGSRFWIELDKAL